MAKPCTKAQNLPDAADFDPYGGCLDAQHAWREFGGLSVEQAYTKFVENPLYYQEDFMFMGGRAFVFYFPVLDRYLREFRVADDPDDEDDSYAAIIGAGFSAQMVSPTSSELGRIMDRISDLVIYVRGHCHQLATEHDEQERIDSYWQILQTQLPNSDNAQKKQG